MAPIPEEKRTESPKPPSGLEIAGKAFETVSATVNFVVSAFAFKELVERGIRAGMKRYIKWYTERQMGKWQEQMQLQTEQIEEAGGANITLADLNLSNMELRKREVNWEVPENDWDERSG